MRPVLRPWAEVPLRIRLWRALWITKRRGRSRVTVRSLAGSTILGLCRVRHGCFQERFIVSPGFDEFFIELRKLIFLLRILSDELDQLRPN
jgi:hypothetical protein